MNIKQVSEITKVPASTIRYYEKEHIIPPLERNNVGVRNFDEHLIRRINFAKTMRAAGMEIAALKKYIYLFDKVPNSQNEQLELLKQQRTIMTNKRDDIQIAINHLNYKIEHFADHMMTSEHELSELKQQRKKD
ncbi:MerR family transcriptional regulator (plasmid) [Nicoliella spurrieriana]|uniref:MerR family transcriptional regulator n=1 Tax=Nicoliella spurrieriana TaxID=2925830 RepID=A0A976RQV1_9LACO|nr:MerR family transcriptional regulator [Nicoliella spurrieriana]UQS86109.1 MerR family transcriptional regulator [Nicoliella spurrieriana]